jgi:hypothetical protein
MAILDLGFNQIGAHQEDTTISGATTLTPPTGATKLLIQALAQNVRFTLDATVPTASVGFQLKAGDPPLLIPIKAGQVVTVIEETASGNIEFAWGN